jgi:ketosteroid isomerase-like protein
MNSNVERNKANAVAFIEAIGRQDPDPLTMYAADGRFFQNGRKLPTAGWHTLATLEKITPAILHQFPTGMQFSFGLILASEDWVVIEAESKAALRDGTPYNNQYVFVFKFDADGKILEFKEYWDTLHAKETLFRDGAFELPAPP